VIDLVIFFVPFVSPFVRFVSPFVPFVFFLFSPLLQW
jgi:hypothetical protein